MRNNKPDDNKFTAESCATVSGCVTCSTSSAAAESCTLSKRAPTKELRKVIKKRSYKNYSTLNIYLT